MRIAVIGGGYVGLVTAACFADLGHDVQLVEQQADRLHSIRSGKAPFYEPLLDQLLAKTLAQNKLSVSSSLPDAVQASQVTFLTVGTPLLDAKIDLQQIETASQSIGETLRKCTDYHTVVVKSTVVPGTTDTTVRQIVEKHSGLKSGQFGLCMNPEFLREGSAVDDFLNPDRIVIGQWDARSGAALTELYKCFNAPFIYTNLRNAELTKYANNSLLALLISFSNELAGICEAIPGMDIDVVMDGVHLDRRLSPIINGTKITPKILTYLRAGCGFGGSCLPKDVNALRGFADQHDVPTPMLDAVMLVNQERSSQLVNSLEGCLGDLKGKNIAVLGLAFKPHTDDVRESPALKIIECMQAKGARIRAYDPLVSQDQTLLAKLGLDRYDSVEAVIEASDAVLIATAWPQFANLDWDVLLKQMRRPNVVDGRRLLSDKSFPDNVDYRPIGTYSNAAEHKRLEKYNA